MKLAVNNGKEAGSS